MSSRTTWSARAGTAVLAVLAGIGAATAPGSAAAASPPETGRQVVSYHGYRIAVPADWRVVDLTANPRACLRFDRPAVFLGEPAEENDCPAHLVGRTAGIVVEPITAGSAGRTTAATARTLRGAAGVPDAKSSGDTIQVAVEDAGVLVTAVHTPETESLVRTALGSAELTGGAERTELPRQRQPDAPRSYAPGPQPGSYLGKGFDACTAPSQAAMDAWRTGSPYRAVGVYISGSFRACAQPNLTAGWVTHQTGNGWRLIPLDVGRQAPCTNFAQRMSADPATAKSQGVSAAAAAITAAKNLGIPTGSTIYSDIESYTSTASCRAAVLSYLSGWTERLHTGSYLSGFYSSASSGIKDAAGAYNNSAYTRVDHIFFGWWNGAADVNTGSYVPSTSWAGHRRIHQYAGEVKETYGGYSITIDRDYLDVGAGAQASSCSETNLAFAEYPTVQSGSTGEQVAAAQCLLTAAGYDPGAADGAYGPSTTAAAGQFQNSRGLAADGVIGPRTWTALLSHGSAPTVRNGSTGESVARLQRALTAALGRSVSVDSVFGPDTDVAVRDYQSSRGLDADGIVGSGTWGALQSGM
ncbi:glycoside hydrolase domain-containing protein [Streptomyces sp. NPDC059695]|uniref:glycoside hydrolase domain-containing protein n=1 Tax=Streptomyces sp. NPDC059695 TaxID=3346910 RepID=UPI00368B3251